MAWKVRYFDYPKQFNAYKKECLRIIEETLARGEYILGEDLKQLEANLANFLGSKFAVGVGNGTEAILLALLAADIGHGDEVITVSHTFVATVEAIKFVGATPVLIDIFDDHNMDVSLVEAAITSKTKAVISVHLNGRVCTDLDKLLKVVKKYNLTLIEDSAQAFGASFNGKKAGTFGLCGCYSFYPAKLFGAFGDAGAIVTNNSGIATKLRCLRNHGRLKGTEVNLWGLNCRMDNLHAAILKYKLRMVPKWIQRRRDIASMYQAGLSGIEGLKLPLPPQSDNKHFDVFQNYEIEAEERDALKTYLNRVGIEVMIPWGGKGVHQFKSLGLSKFVLPKTEKFFSRALMLPMYAELTDKEVRCVIKSIQNFYRKKNKCKAI